MVIAKIKVDGVSAVATELSQIPKGIQGATIEVTYDSAWESLNKTAVFSGSVVKDVVNVGAVISVPPETVAKSGHRLRVGFYGVDGENKVIIPTLWVDLGAIQSAADPSGDTSTNPSLPVWAQLQAEFEALKEAGGIKGEKGDKGDPGADGKDYILTEADKKEIAGMVDIPEVNLDGYAAAIIGNKTGEVIAVNDSTDLPLRGLTLYGKTSQNGTPAPDNPVELESVGDDGSVTVTVCGKNLLKNTATDRTLNGVTYTVNNDGSVTLNGTPTGENASFEIGEVTLPPGEYIVSKGVHNVFPQLWFYVDGTKMFNVDAGERSFTLTAPSVCRCNIYHSQTGVYNQITVYPMIRFASVTDSTYEPYKDGVSVTAQTPNGLPGIPVSSGGNYTDENGQKWICDEIDFARGKYVQRMKNVTFTGDENVTYASSLGQFRYEVRDMLLPTNNEENPALLCTCYPVYSYNVGTKNPYACFASVGVQWIRWVNTDYNADTLSDFKESLIGQSVLYALSTPIETDLTAEEIAQYSALHTNYPNTTIYNDEGAGMAVKYVADTKLYIDNKFSELQNAILSAGANV